VCEEADKDKNKQAAISSILIMRQN